MLGEGGTAPVVSTWAGAVQVHRQPAIPRSSFVQQLEAEASEAATAEGDSCMSEAPVHAEVIMAHSQHCLTGMALGCTPREDKSDSLVPLPASRVHAEPSILYRVPARLVLKRTLLSASSRCSAAAPGDQARSQAQLQEEQQAALEEAAR